jgi:hypothetical protein
VQTRKVGSLLTRQQFSIAPAGGKPDARHGIFFGPQCKYLLPTPLFHGKFVQTKDFPPDGRAVAKTRGERCWRRNCLAKSFCSNWTCGRLFPEHVMSNTVPQQQSGADAARSDVPSAHRADRPLPEFQPHTPIEREIERSERASAALAATRALARAAFTDSQLAAADEADAAVNGHDGDIDTSGWVRTEYAALDHSLAARDPQDDQAPGAAARNLVGGSFNPGIASQHGRAYPGASIAQSPIKTRTGAHARFLQESRHTPRAERVASGPAHYDKPAVLPMLATPTAAPAARRAVNAPARAPARAPMADAVKFALAAGIGAVVVLIGGGLAWKTGLLSHSSPTDASVITAQLAAQAEAARLLSAQSQEIAITPPAAGGVSSTRSNEEVDAALAAAARAAAVPMASVHAAGPSRVTRAQPAVVAPAAAVATTGPAIAPVAPQRPAVHGKDSVAAAIANAQARADSFLASGGSAPAATAPTEARKPD